MTVVAPPTPNIYIKKGVPLQTIWSNREMTSAQEKQACIDLKVGWAYNYLPSWDNSAPGVQFYPMIFDHAHATAPNLATAAAYNTIILGFNEPYNPSPQGNITQAQAASDWPLFTATGKRLASPSTILGNNWLPASGSVGGSFVSILGSAQWDYTAIHYYSSNFSQPDVNQASLETWIDTIYAAYNKRIIISEIGLINFIGGPATWLYGTVAQSIAQIQLSSPRLNGNPKVIGWTWYPLTIDAAARAVNANAANSTLLNLDGSLTALGTAYAGLVNYP